MKKLYVIIAIILGISTFAYYRSSSSCNSTQLPSSLTKNVNIINQKQVIIAHHALAPNDDGVETLKPQIFIDGSCQTNTIQFNGESGDQGVSLHKAFIQNVDTDDQDELVTEWILNWGGSGGYKALIVWDVGDQITPVLGLPTMPASRNVLVMDVDGNQVFSAPATDMYAFTHIDPTTKRLYFAAPKYDQSVPHFDPQPWEISVYKLNGNNTYEFDANWNNGTPLHITDRYSIDDPDIKSNLLKYYLNGEST